MAGTFSAWRASDVWQRFSQALAPGASRGPVPGAAEPLVYVLRDADAPAIAHGGRLLCKQAWQKSLPWHAAAAAKACASHAADVQTPFHTYSSMQSCLVQPMDMGEPCNRVPATRLQPPLVCCLRWEQKEQSCWQTAPRWGHMDMYLCVGGAGSGGDVRPTGRVKTPVRLEPQVVLLITPCMLQR